MTTIPVGYGQARAMYLRLGATRPSVVTWGYDMPSADPSVHANDIYVRMTNVNRPCAAVNMSSDWSFLGVQVTEMTDTGELSGSYMNTVTGTGALPALPPNVAVLINKSTGAGGRRNRGRLYVPPVFPSEGNFDRGGVIAPASLASLQTWWDGVYGDLNALGLGMRILHENPPFTPTIVTSLEVQSLCATQRRRLRK